MSHTTRTKQVTFIHDGDFNGDVKILFKGNELEIPMDDLKSFMAHFLRSKKHARIDGMSDKQILGID